MTTKLYNTLQLYLFIFAVVFIHILSASLQEVFERITSKTD